MSFVRWWWEEDEEDQGEPTGEHDMSELLNASEADETDDQ